MSYNVNQEGILGKIWDLIESEEDKDKKIFYLKCYCISLSNETKRLKEKLKISNSRNMDLENVMKKFTVEYKIIGCVTVDAESMKEATIKVINEMNIEEILELSPVVMISKLGD